MPTFTAGPLAARVKRAAAFVAIVWGVAATFVVFEVAALRGTDLAIAYQELFGSLLLSSAVSDSTTCVSDGDGAAGAAEARTARAQVWGFGLLVGHDAIFRQFQAIDPQALAELAAQIDRSAAALGVPAPERFTPRQLANANTEFVAFIEADNRATARGLARRYSPQVCHLYKLGAVWGYSEVVRRALPGERAAFAVEIRHYARLANLPEEMWRPMLAPTPAAATRAELDADTAALTDAITRHLSN